MGLLFKRGTTANKPTLSNGEIYIDSTKKSITAKVDDAEFDVGNTGRMKKIILNLKNKSGNFTDWGDSSVYYSNDEDIITGTSILVSSLSRGIIVVGFDPALNPDSAMRALMNKNLITILNSAGSKVLNCVWGFSESDPSGLTLAFLDGTTPYDMEGAEENMILIMEYLKAEPT